MRRPPPGSWPRRPTCAAGRWHVLVDLRPRPGLSDEAIRIYLARDLADVSEADRHVGAEEETDLGVHRLPLDEAVAAVLAGDDRELARGRRAARGRVRARPRLGAAATGRRALGRRPHPPRLILATRPLGRSGRD